MSTVEIQSPRNGATVSSPLAVVKIAYSGTRAHAAVLTVGRSTYVVELDGASGVLRENVTLVEGDNVITVRIGQTEATATVALPPSRHVQITAPGDLPIATRATPFTGDYEAVSCPAGVISVNGFLQQFAVGGTAGQFAEAVVLRPGSNHLAVQIGEYYATKVVEGQFEAARVLATLVWDTPTTDLDLYVREPSGDSVWYSNKVEKGTLDVDRTQGFGPENYSVVPDRAKKGDYRVRVHYYSDRGLGRSEWTVRVITDEGTSKQQRRTFYGILDGSHGNQGANGSGPDWNDVCTVRIGERNAVTILAPGEV